VAWFFCGSGKIFAFFPHMRRVVCSYILYISSGTHFAREFISRIIRGSSMKPLFWSQGGIVSLISVGNTGCSPFVAPCFRLIVFLVGIVLVIGYERSNRIFESSRSGARLSLNYYVAILHQLLVRIFLGWTRTGEISNNIHITTGSKLPLGR